VPHVVTSSKKLRKVSNKTIELWRRALDCLWQACEAQIRGFQTAVTKMTEPVMKGEA